MVVGYCNGLLLCTTGNKGCATIDSNLKFKVVRIPLDDLIAKCEFAVEVFSSETGQSPDSVVSSPKPIYWSIRPTNAVVYNGLLRWMTRGNEIVVYDSYSDRVVLLVEKPKKAYKIHGSELSHVKERIDAIDKENLTYDYSVIGGDPALLNKALDKISFQIKVESSPDGGSIFKRSSKSYTIDGAEVNEEEIKAGQEKAMEAFVGIFRAFEAYILANPDV
ncbi:hypothetical protein GH714_031893 [Hevea brasiliensis]|uniref:Bet v I/Major latex protein domain-containing protein n=1 Tax=Hevea brasiliensis TaxID=3981 RepID=A0A6A6KP71_HEVBR|nr:hypothetical protein GH714_031893 [Hevea brasiliensis]